MKKAFNYDNFVRFLPIVCVELFLFGVLFLYLWGPLDYGMTNNTMIFWYLTALHLAFAFGYFFAFRKKKINRTFTITTDVFVSLFLKYYWILFAICVVAFYFRINVIIDINTPLDFFKAVINGFQNPTEQYIKKHFILPLESKKFILACIAVDGILAPLTFSFVPASFLLRDKLIGLKRYALYIIIALQVCMCVAIGSNALNFIMAIILAIVFVTCMVIDFPVCKWKTIRKNIEIFITFLLLVTFSLGFFYYTINKRTAGNMVGAFTSGNADSAQLRNPTPSVLKPEPSKTQPEPSKTQPEQTTSKSKLEEYQILATYYSTNSVRGLALAMEQPYVPTYGLGHSSVLYQAVENLFGINVEKNTYTGRVRTNEGISNTGVATPADFASDITFPGVIVLMGFLGYFFASCWKYAVYRRNVLMIAQLPLWGLFFLSFYGFNPILHDYYYYFSMWGLAAMFLLPVIISKRKGVKRLEGQTAE